MTRLLLLLITCLFFSAAIVESKPRKKKAAPAVSAQSIKKRQKENERVIRETSKKIKDNKAMTERQLGKLNSLLGEINETDKSISQHALSIDSIDKAMVSLSDSIASLEAKTKKMKEKYAVAIKKFQGKRTRNSTLAFIFSAESFRQSYRRMRYMRQFSNWRARKTQEIRDALQHLAQQRNELGGLKVERGKTVQKLSVARTELNAKRKETSVLVALLQKEGAALKELLRRKEREARDLDNQLNKIIADEIKRKEEAERKSRQEQETRRKAEKDAEKRRHREDDDKTEPKPQPKPGVSEPNSSFELSKGRLPYPVDGRCRIIRRFGAQNHPELKNITLPPNSGIDLEVASKSSVRAIFDGKVSAIFQQTGFGTVVMVRHGSYISIYAGLGTISVAPGATVKAGQTLGSLSADGSGDGRSVLHFEIRKERQKLNPEQWLR